MLQGILNFRFTNNLFEREWNRTAIESIDITLLESIGAEKRGAFYDSVGALRDVGQNHLLQMLALVTMEQPASDGADDIRDARAALIESLAPMTPGEVADVDVPRAVPRASARSRACAPDSDTETYFQLRTRMTGRGGLACRVTMESGKSMGEACKHIVVTFRQPEPCLCPRRCAATPTASSSRSSPPTRSRSCFFAKKPGFEDEVEERALHLLPLREDREGAVRRGVRASSCTTRSRRPDAVRLDARGRRRLALHRPDRRRRGRPAPCRSSTTRPAPPTSSRVPTRRWHGEPTRGQIGRLRARQDGRGTRAATWSTRLATSSAGTATHEVARGAWRADGLDARRDAARPGRRAARRRASIWLMVPAGAPVDDAALRRRGHGARRSCSRRATPSSTAATRTTATPRRAPSGSPSSASTSSTAARAAVRRARATARA